jgi:hypothetical protein
VLFGTTLGAGALDAVTSRVTENLIKLIKLELNYNARLNQDTKVWNQI